jgi:D-glycero-alpha-D-manno-heptose 1-phosphate guanylyltransferase
MDVIILAGGLGTRLRSVVSEVPKCMATVCGKPFLSYLFNYLSRYPEVKNVILSVGYLKEVIMDWSDQQKTPFTVLFSTETEPLGTGGAIKQALEMAKSDDVLILNGDTFFDVDLNKFFTVHKSVPAQLSIALKPMQHFDRYGNVAVNSDRIIITFDEKKYCEKGHINGGVYLLSAKNRLMDNLPAKFSFETEVLQTQVQSQLIYGFVQDTYFIDIGIPEDYEKANTEFKNLFDNL